MRLPDGRECPYYYADFHRRAVGVETCRLLEHTNDAPRWSLQVCATCPVPAIRRVNACPHLEFIGRLQRRWGLFGAWRMVIQAFCSQEGVAVADPYVGCGHCHRPVTFVVAGEEPESKP